MVKIFIYSILTCAFAVLTVQARNSGYTRIMKGKIAERGMMSFMASLWVFDNHICGASIVGEYWILTAAHCVHYKETGNVVEDEYISVSVGSELYKSGYVYRIERKVVHEGFDYESQVNDIVLLKVPARFNFSPTMKPIRLDPYPIDDYDRPVECFVAGWGLTEETYDSPDMVATDKLRYARVNTIPLPYCKKTYVSLNESFVPSETNICVFTMVGRGTCIGDSGAPLIMNNQQVGILSVGGACDNMTPEVYTRLSSYYTWIKKAMGAPIDTCGHL